MMLVLSSAARLFGMRRRGALVAMVVLLGAMNLAPADGAAVEKKAELGSCPVNALKKAKKPVEITFWHVFVDQNEKVLQQITDGFNSSQQDVHVKLVNQVNYDDEYNKYTAGFTSGDLPDLAQMEETRVQRLLDTQTTVNIGACVKADHYSLKDFLPRAIAYYTTEGVLHAMPWNVSNPVLFYNKIMFEKAGLDPNKPPTTLEEMRAYAQQIVDRGVAPYGAALRSEPFVNEFLYAKNGQAYVNNGNGRNGRATKALLVNKTGRTIWTWWKGMVDDHLALNTGSAQGNIDHLLALVVGNAAMSIDATSVLGPATAAIGSGEVQGVELGVGKLPGIKTGGGTPVGDGSLWMINRSSKVKQAAAWDFIKYLVSTPALIELHVGTGYVPIRRSVADSPEVQAKWQADPQYKVGYDQLVEGPNDIASRGPVVGAYEPLRDAVRNGLLAMLDRDVAPEKALKTAEAATNKAIAAYNSRL